MRNRESVSTTRLEKWRKGFPANRSGGASMCTAMGAQRMTKTTQAIGAKEDKGKADPISRKSKLLAMDGKVAKRTKTGGRSRPSLAHRLELAIQRSRIATLDDDTTLDSELAALYLGISEKKLEELRWPPKDSDIFTAPRLTFLKIYDHGATGRNQAVMYKLGDLRDYQRRLRATDTFESATNVGIAGWMTARQPFYTKTIQGIGDVVLADAWASALTKSDPPVLTGI